PSTTHCHDRSTYRNSMRFAISHVRFAASRCGATATPSASAATNNAGPASDNSEFSAGQRADERSEQRRYLCRNQKPHQLRTEKSRRQKVSHYLPEQKSSARFGEGPR